MNIGIKLNKNFTTAFNKMLAEYGEDMARLNGFADSQLSYTDFIDNFLQKDTVADSSIDGSANVSQKDIVTLLTEMPKPHMKLLAYHKIYCELNEKYGFKTANAALRALWDGHLYLHDGDTSTFKSYCYQYDLKDLAEKGLFFIENFNAEPPKHADTFIDFVKEYISYTCNRSSGAVGLPNLIPYLYYFCNRDKQKGYCGDYERYCKQQIQRFVYAVNQPFLRNSSQSAFTNVSFFDHEYLNALFGGATFPDGSLMIDEIEGIMELQKLFLTVMSEIRTQNVCTYPVSTISLLRKNGKFTDEEFARWACEHNRKWCDSNFYIDDSVSSLSNCCRLRSDISELYFNSIGGTALSVGSVKVSTINLARLALENKTENEYLLALKEMSELNLKILDVVRHIIKRNVEKGLLKNFSYGLIDFAHLYSTQGVIGIYETLKTFGYTREDEFNHVYYTKEAEEFGKKIFDTIHAVANAFKIGKDYMINCEAVPQETAAAKLMKKDEFFYPDTVVKDLPLYGNQFLPLGIKATLAERTRVAAMFDSFCNGGSILHINLAAPFSTKEKAWDMLNWVADQGVTYFAFNPRIQACAKNHGYYGKICPVCGGKTVTEYTRIVGFFVSVRTYSEERKKEYALRQWEGEEK